MKLIDMDKELFTEKYYLTEDWKRNRDEIHHALRCPINDYRPIGFESKEAAITFAQCNLKRLKNNYLRQAIYVENTKTGRKVLIWSRN